ncbi:MAG: DEAD/DEAH box helicase [Bacteroidia bacterium]
MAYIKDLLTGKTDNKQILPETAIKAQRLATCMAWQILHDYPTRKTPKAWQIYSNLRGVMLADEVGGGKTFETLAIISKALLEKKSTRERFRVLIIANPSIRLKWKWEDKCDIVTFINQTNVTKTAKEKLTYFFSSQKIITKKAEWKEIYKSNQGVWLSSFPSIPSVKDGGGDNAKFVTATDFPKNFFDWIIVDEAHALKAGSIDTAEETSKLDGVAVRKINAVLNTNDKAKILLLTATPFQNNTEELKQLLGLLERNPKHITSLIAKGLNALDKQIKELTDNPKDITVENLKGLRKNIDHDIHTLIGDENLGEQRPKMESISNKVAPCKNGLDDYLRDVLVRNTKELLTITPVPVTLTEQEQLQYLLYRELIGKKEQEEDDPKNPMFNTKLSQLVSSNESYSKNNINENKNKTINNLLDKNTVVDAKYTKLIETINEIKNSKQKNVIVVFVSWLDSVTALENKLISVFNKSNVFTLTGNTPTEDRKTVLENVANRNKKVNESHDETKILLIVSRVGNEGLDFDKFSNRVIHYDNNFNPAVIDQRNGRVYRGSNITSKNKNTQADDIEIYQLFIQGTYDQRILLIEQEKRKMKNFYLGDHSLQQVLEKIFDNDKDEQEILNVLKTITIDLTPSKNYILAKYKKEIK